ncbi:MAG TPA: exodeoxyribonuclease VII large subunit [Deltaproteobacteria bacterium]|nr:exodeoxyribonuclease VII large subunit [Deltaproteobacteria bacterium]
MGVDCLSVSELNERAREALAGCFGPEVWVAGEIFGLKEHAKSGHVYFDLVEKPAAGSEQYIARISCAFFRGSIVQWQRSLHAAGLKGFTLSSGIEVKLKARVDLFVKEGRYQLIVSEIDPSYTFGAIERRRAQTIETLRGLGLMERNKARELGELPLTIGLITSHGSAAYQDFTSIVLGSPYAFRIMLYDSHMQGENVVKEVCAGIRALQKVPAIDVIVIIRGGGARTDLFVFDDLTLCRAVAECTKPVITGIGHEIDLSVADMVAHTRFVTPTDAARFLVSRVDGVWAFLEESSLSLVSHARRLLDESAQRLGRVAARIALATQQRSARARSSLHAALSSLMQGATGLVGAHQKRLVRLCMEARSGPLSALHQASHALKARQGLMLRDISQGLKERLAALESHERELELMRPARVLSRGYSITLAADGGVLRDASRAAIDDHIVSVLHQGRIRSVVCEKEPSEQ